MSIADELRREAQGHLRYVYTTEHAKHLLAIADRIDAEHEEALQREHESAYDKGYDAGFASADDWCAQHEDAMAEHGWYRALDADKQVIHADDELFWKDDGTPVGRVTAIGVGQRAGLVWTLVEGDTVSIGHNANLLRHKQPDSWECIIKDAMEGADRDGSPDTYQECVAELVARCKALAGDGE